MKIPVADMPTIETERQPPQARNEVCRDDVYVDGVLVGQVEYVRRRKVAGPTEFGWRPVVDRRSRRLTSRADAIRRLVG